MPLRLYNSLGRKLSQFKPIASTKVTMYTCGPTVYSYAHIGNFRTFVFEDLLRLYLEYKGYRVTLVKNITDVEDRIIEGIKKTGMTREALTDKFTKAFMDDLATLNIEPARHYPRATDFIDDIVETVKSLMRKGFAYRADDGSIYYSIEKFADYGKLSGIKPDEMRTGARVAQDHYEKMGANDFALWKAWDPADGAVFWETEIGKGRPGWHIECSVMSMKYLGKSFDIHTGGKDLRFPHHENEIAQSEALTGKKFVRYWLHSEFLVINGEKMSKSLGNLVTLRDLMKQGWSPRAVRLFLISAHYRDELNLADNSMVQTAATMGKIDKFYQRLSWAGKHAARGKASIGRPFVDSFLKSFDRAMDDDLNTPRALAALFDFQRGVNKLIDSRPLATGDYKLILDALEAVDDVLGIMQYWNQRNFAVRELQGAPEEMDSLDGLLLERERARKQKDYARADEIRELLREKGYGIEDTPEGAVLRRLSTPS